MSGLGEVATDDQSATTPIGDLKSMKMQKRWVDEIRLYETKAEKWEQKGKKILRRYKDDRSDDKTRSKSPRFNILWSITESATPALFGANPKPDIERRFRDKDDLGRISSMVLERSISYFINENFGDVVRLAVKDRLLPGRGTVWVRYEPHFKDAEVNENEEVSNEGEEITDQVEAYADEAGIPEDGNEQPQEIANETVCFDYVHWQDWLNGFGRTWDEVPWIGRIAYMTRDALENRFGEEIGKEIQLDYSPHDLKDSKYEEIEKKATIYELWDKETKKVYWIHKDYLAGPLDEQDDPLGIDGFWPCPMPLYATLANDDMIPVPDYVEWQDQAMELDELTCRIGAITKAIKVAGVYDKTAQGIERILAEGVENTLVPVEQWAILSEKGGLKGVMALLPMEEILNTLLGLYKTRDQVKQDLYEISGSADIMRGQSDPDETATAQNIKSQFGTMRLNDKQEQVKRFCRDLVKIGTQIVAKHFSIDTIKKICGVQLMTAQEKQLVQMRMKALQKFQQVQQQFQQQQKAAQQPPQPGMPPQQAQPMMPPQMPQLPPLPPDLQKADQEDMDELMANPTWEEVEDLLKDDITLAYKIDIETDSTLKPDQEADKASRIEFLEAVGKFMGAIEQNQNPILAPLYGKLLEFGVRGFKIGKELETAFDTTIHKMEKEAENPQKKPDPEMAKVQGEQQIEQQRMQNDMRVEQQKSQDEQKRLSMQAQVDAHQGQVDAEVEKYKIQLQGQMDMAKAKLDSDTKIFIAELQAKAAAQQQEMAGQQQAQQNSADIGGVLATVSDQLKQLLSNQNTSQ